MLNVNLSFEFRLYQNLYTTNTLNICLLLKKSFSCFFNFFKQGCHLTWKPEKT